jgi:hypothetical protein
MTKNLQIALHHMGLETEERIMWIHALCIDQRSIEERSSQVAQMHRISTLATMVVVVLDKLWDRCNVALDYIAFIGSHFNLHLDPSLEPHALCHDVNTNWPLLQTCLPRFFGSP